MRKVLLKPIDGGEVLEVAVQQSPGGEPGARQVSWGERTVDVVVEPDDGEGGVLRLQGRVVPFHAVRAKGVVRLWIGGRTYSFELPDRAASRGSGAGAGAVTSSLAAPMPGTILKISVQLGDAFEASQPLIIMESMKMEMTLSAPHGGRIKRIACAVGQLVQQGALLAEFEPPEADDESSA